MGLKGKTELGFPSQQLSILPDGLLWGPFGLGGGRRLCPREQSETVFPPSKLTLDGCPATESPPNMGRKMHDSEDKTAKEG